MNINVNIKSVGQRYGTVGWLKEQLENGVIWLEESNNFYIPPWGNSCSYNTLTHGLVIRDKNNRALIAYRDMDGDYVYNVGNALGDSPCSHWVLNLTEAAKDILRDICREWIDKQPEE